jgi:uncharacterized membrane protein YecN with MAPEG domain
MLNNGHQAAALWCGLLLILLLVLAVRVVGQRRTHQVLLGDGGKEGLTLASRTFGNATEYIPAGMAAIILLTVLGASIYLIHFVGLVLFAGRVLHAMGMSASKLTAGRMAGMILTFAAYIIAAITLLFYAFR